MTERICIVPRVHGVGGMVSFLHKFSESLAARGVGVTFDLQDEPYSAILVIGGTRQLTALLRARARVVQRLDGINWIHRKKPVSLKHSLRSAYGNFILSVIRRFVADRIVYQSAFSRDWWNDWYGRLKTPSSVVHNGVDLDAYQPTRARTANPRHRLLVVEGSMGGGYEGGLANAVRLAEAAAGLLSNPLELMVVGEVSESLRVAWQARSAVPILWQGPVARERIPHLMNEADALFSADVHPACPNSVIEALACGLPVVAYDTGSLKELVADSAGVVAPYGADAWALETPVVGPLAQGLAQVLTNPEKFRQGRGLTLRAFWVCRR
jgi:glycosyltransferase involved in cell wall biosynthesis